MTPIAVGYIGLIALIVLMFSGLHIGAVMGLVGFLGLVYITGWEPALSVLMTVPYTTFANYDFSVLPLFLLMGEFAFYAGISGDMYYTVHKFLGNLRGGLAMATIGGCAAFAAVCGSSIATAVTMSTASLPEMRKYKYDPSLATGALAAGGTIGILIPPSVPMIIYCMIAEESIGKLFLAGFIPGIIQAGLFILVIAILCWRNPNLGPPGPATSLKEKIISLKNTWIVVLLFLLVIGGIYAGVFSPTEGAGVGAAGTFFFALARRRLHGKEFMSAIVETAKASGMVLFIVVGALILGYFLAVTRVPFELARVIGSIPVSPYIVWALIVILYIFLGCIMDTLSMILLTVPILYPVMAALGFDLIWFGIMVVVMAEMGMITPPVGMNVFVIKGMAPDIPTYSIFRGILPFFYADIVLVVLFTAFPIIVLWLPQVLM